MPKRLIPGACRIGHEPDVQVGQNFWLSEFRSRDWLQQPDRPLMLVPALLQRTTLPLLVRLLERYRGVIGPIAVGSAYRTISRNQICGGASLSNHLVCGAADFLIGERSYKEMCEIHTIVGIPHRLFFYHKRERPFVHVDIGLTRQAVESYIASNGAAIHTSFRNDAEMKCYIKE